MLIGDPAQLDAIEAGGLFSAIARRGDPVVLDEVIRHNHDLDREAAKQIREGMGAQALSLYRSAERVTVAPYAEARREAMVADWLASYRNGDDALMVAQRNAEVERLNAIARELLRAEGMLGEHEIEVGGAPFAAGDRAIARSTTPPTTSTTASAGRWPRSTPSENASPSRTSTATTRSRSDPTTSPKPPLGGAGAACP